MGVRRDRTAALLAVTGLGLACALVAFAVYRLAVWTVPGRVLDGHALRGALASRSRLDDAVEQSLDVVSVAALLAAAAVVAVIALLRLRRGVGLAALALLGGANLTGQLLKRVVLDRPDLGLAERTPATLNSMPSGHTTVAFSVVAALVVVLPARVRPAVAVAGVGYAWLTAAATMSAGWHRPSDSVVSVLVVGGWVALVAAAVLLVEDRTSALQRWSGREARAGRRLAISGAALLVAGTLLAGLAALVGLRPGGTTSDVLAYLAGLAVIAGTAAATMAAVLALVPVLTFAEVEPAQGPEPG